MNISNLKNNSTIIYRKTVLSAIKLSFRPQMLPVFILYIIKHGPHALLLYFWQHLLLLNFEVSIRNNCWRNKLSLQSYFAKLFSCIICKNCRISLLFDQHPLFLYFLSLSWFSSNIHRLRNLWISK